MKNNMKKYLSAVAVYKNVYGQKVTESIMDVDAFGCSAKVLVGKIVSEGIVSEYDEFYANIPVIDFEDIAMMEECEKLSRITAEEYAEATADFFEAVEPEEAFFAVFGE